MIARSTSSGDASGPAPGGRALAPKTEAQRIWSEIAWGTASSWFQGSSPDSLASGPAPELVLLIGYWGSTTLYGASLGFCEPLMKASYIGVARASLSASG